MDPEWWRELPTDQVIVLTGTELDYLERSADPLPEDAPAMLFLRGLPSASKPAIIRSVLDRIDRAAISLYPTWLPGAAEVDSRGNAAHAAVRSLARRQAGQSEEYAVFLTDIAARAQTGVAGEAGLLDEVRLAGLVRLLEQTYQRQKLALVVEAPDAATPQHDGELVAAAEWLSTFGPIGVWLVGGPRSIDWLPVIDLIQPTDGDGQVPVESSAQTTITPPDLVFPAISGIPHPGSPAEQALELALRQSPWATGRVWNQVMDFGPVSRPIRVDLLWAAERCVVEIDGDEHRLQAHYAADRRRDVRLQLAGFAVLRFTNDQIYHDLATTLTALNPQSPAWWPSGHR